MSTKSKLQAASEAAESWLNTVSLVAMLGKKGSVDAAFKLLVPHPDDSTIPNLLDSYNEHAAVVMAEQDELKRQSDSPVTLPGRGRVAIAANPESNYPLYWSSAHEAAVGITRMMLVAIVEAVGDIADPAEQRAAAERLLVDRWPMFSLTMEEVATLQERIRRERAKLAAIDPFLPAESPKQCAKRMGRGLDWVKARIDDGQLRHEKVSARSWRLHRDDVRKLGGQVARAGRLASREPRHNYGQPRFNRVTVCIRQI